MKNWILYVDIQELMYMIFYFEQYAGFIDKNTTGWICDYPLAKLSEGKHNITAKCVGKDRVLAEKQIEFSIVGEE